MVMVSKAFLKKKVTVTNGYRLLQVARLPQTVGHEPIQTLPHGGICINQMGFLRLSCSCRRVCGLRKSASSAQRSSDNKITVPITEILKPWLPSLFEIL